MRGLASANGGVVRIRNGRDDFVTFLEIAWLRLKREGKGGRLTSREGHKALSGGKEKKIIARGNTNLGGERGKLNLSYRPRGSSFLRRRKGGVAVRQREGRNGPSKKQKGNLSPLISAHEATEIRGGRERLSSLRPFHKKKQHRTGCTFREEKPPLFSVPKKPCEPARKNSSSYFRKGKGLIPNKKKYVMCLRREGPASM